MISQNEYTVDSYMGVTPAFQMLRIRILGAEIEDWYKSWRRRRVRQLVYIYEGTHINKCFT